MNSDDRSSTTLGSIGVASTFKSNPVPAYKITKAALNMLTKQYAEDLADEGFTFLAVSPGVCSLLFSLSMIARATVLISTVAPNGHGWIARGSSSRAGRRGGRKDHEGSDDSTERQIPEHPCTRLGEQSRVEPVRRQGDPVVGQLRLKIDDSDPDLLQVGRYL